MNLVPDWLAWWLRDRKEIGGFDLPDQRDWTSQKLFGSYKPPRVVKAGKDVDLMNMYAYNQGGSQSCTSQGVTATTQTMIRFGAVFKEYKDNVLFNLDGKPFQLWEDQQVKYKGTDGTADLSLGDYLQNALKTAKVRGIPILIGKHLCIAKVKGYSKISSSEVSEWLERGHPVFTGSRWILGRNGKRYLAYNSDGYLFANGEGRDVGGHAWFIVGKKRVGNKTHYKMQNSHGTRWGIRKDGTAWFTEEKLKECFSKYIINLDWEDIQQQIKNPAYAQQQVAIYDSTKK